MSLYESWVITSQPLFRFHTFQKSTFQTNTKTVCLRAHIFSRITSFLYYTFSLHWHLSLKSPFAAVVLLMAGQVTGTAPAGSLQLQHSLDVDTAHSNTSCQLPPHSSHKQLTLLLLFGDQTTVASNWSAWVIQKAMSFTQCPASTYPAASFRNTGSHCGCIKEIPHKHLSSQEHYLKTKTLRRGLYFREQCLLQMCLHLPEYVGTQFPLESVGHRC